MDAKIDEFDHKWPKFGKNWVNMDLGGVCGVWGWVPFYFGAEIRSGLNYTRPNLTLFGCLYSLTLFGCLYIEKGQTRQVD